MRDTRSVPRWITPWRTERVCLSCPLPPTAALRHLAAGIDARRQWHLRQHLYAEAEFMILGHADDSGIQICAARPHITNSYRTYLHARMVPDGSGSRLEGCFGWLPSVRLFIAAQYIALGLLWCGSVGFVIRSLFIGGPLVNAVGGVILIPVVLAIYTGFIALCERLARAEATRLRAWLTTRLDDPAPAPPPASPPPPRRPPAAIRPPVPT